MFFNQNSAHEIRSFRLKQSSYVEMQMPTQFQEDKDKARSPTGVQLTVWVVVICASAVFFHSSTDHMVAASCHTIEVPTSRPSPRLSAVSCV